MHGQSPGFIEFRNAARNRDGGSNSGTVNCTDEACNRTEGHKSSQARMCAAGCGPVHFVHGDRNLREPEPSRLPAGIRYQIGCASSATEQASSDHFGRRSRFGVLLRRQDNDGLRAGENLVAIADAPPTVDDMLATAFHSAAIYFPFDDVIVTDPYKDIAEGLKVAFYVGQSHIVGGITTDIVAYESGGVFIEAWIGADDKLPRLVRAVYENDPLQSRHAMIFSNWQLDVAVPADSFSTSKASSAKRIKFASPDLPPNMSKPNASAN